MSAYMKIDDINGNVSASGHKNEIELASFNFEIARANHLNVGQTHNRLPGAPILSTLNITKPYDNSSNALAEHALTGKVIDEILISICRTDKQLTSYLKYTLKNVLVTHYHKDYAAGSFPVEELELSFTEIQTDYYPTDASGNIGSPYRMGYDLAKAALL